MTTDNTNDTRAGEQPKPKLFKLGGDEAGWPDVFWLDRGIVWHSNTIEAVYQGEPSYRFDTPEAFEAAKVSGELVPVDAAPAPSEAAEASASVHKRIAAERGEYRATMMGDAAEAAPIDRTADYTAVGPVPGDNIPPVLDDADFYRRQSLKWRNDANELQRQLEEARASLSRLQQEIAQLNERIADRDGTVYAQTGTIERLQQENGELQAMRWRQVKEEMPPRNESVLRWVGQRADVAVLDDADMWWFHDPVMGEDGLLPEDWWQPISLPPVAQEGPRP